MIKIVTQEAPVLAPVPEPDEGPTLTERLDDLTQRLAKTAELRAKQAKSVLAGQIRENEKVIEELTAAMCEEMEDKLETDDEWTLVHGATHKARLGPVPNKRTVTDNDKVIEFLSVDVDGEPAWKKIIKFTLGDLDKYLNPLQLAEVIETTREGKRSFTIKPK